MYSLLDFSVKPVGGQNDGKRRYYVAVTSADPERTKLQRWEIMETTLFSRAVRLARSARSLPDLWSGATIIEKTPRGDLGFVYANFATLTGWAADDGWNCWGALVLVGAITELETGHTSDAKSGRTWCTWCENDEPLYPRILETRIPATAWPMAADEGRRTDDA